jgi:hypothetical protein
LVATSMFVSSATQVLPVLMERKEAGDGARWWRRQTENATRREWGNKCRVKSSGVVRAVPKLRGLGLGKGSLG